MYGAKLGYFFDSVKWLGVETEVFRTTPHIEQQTVTTRVPGGGSASGTMTGSNLRVVTWAPANLTVRYQLGQLEPYAGFGTGIFFARLKDKQTHESTSSTAVGLNAQVGLRYRVPGNRDNMVFFGEWKFNHARFHFDETPRAFGDIDATYNVQHLLFGLGYFF